MGYDLVYKTVCQHNNCGVPIVGRSANKKYCPKCAKARAALLLGATEKERVEFAKKEEAAKNKVLEQDEEPTFAWDEVNVLL